MIGCFFSLALLFDGLGLFAMGVGGRRIVGMVEEGGAAEEGEARPSATRPWQSLNKEQKRQDRSPD